LLAGWSGLAEGLADMTASDVVRLADWLKPGDRPIAAVSALLDQLEQGGRPWRSG
jgi:hypothetical protein